LLRFSDVGRLLLRLMVACVFVASGCNPKEDFVWNGWHYDLMLLVMNLVIVATGGGKLVVLA